MNFHVTQQSLEKVDKVKSKITYKPSSKSLIRTKVVSKKPTNALQDKILRRNKTPSSSLEHSESEMDYTNRSSLYPKNLKQRVDEIPIDIGHQVDALADGH